jgi:hypothetical protein
MALNSVISIIFPYTFFFLFYYHLFEILVQNTMSVMISGHDIFNHFCSYLIINGPLFESMHCI